VAAESYEVTFSEDRAEIIRRDGAITTTLQVIVSPEDDAVISKDQLANAQVRTTCVTTMLKAAPQDNVLPTTAEATVNCRILPDETRDALANQPEFHYNAQNKG